MKPAEIERLLPGIFQRTLHTGSPLDALLDVMDALHQPAEDALAGLDATLDPRRTRDDFVPFLARWVDLDRIFEPGLERGHPAAQRAPISSGLGHLRELTASAAWLSKWRGTARGLQRFLYTATGEPHFAIREHADSQGRPRRFHLVVYAPTGVQRHRALIERIIDSEKPAYVTAELIFGEPPKLTVAPPRG